MDVNKGYEVFGTYKRFLSAKKKSSFIQKEFREHLRKHFDVRVMDFGLSAKNLKAYADKFNYSENQFYTEEIKCPDMW